MRKHDEFDTKSPPHSDLGNMGGKIIRVDEQQFTKEIDFLIKQAEEMRLMRMRQHRTLTFMAMNINILSMTIGVGLFAWFFLMQLNLPLAFSSLLASLTVPIATHFWAASPIKAYQRDHKSKFMPALAKALNGLDFFPERGVSEKILPRLKVIPPYETYKAEDCFMGTYKGMKAIICEARLYNKDKKNGMVFDGLFVLLESPNDVIEGHTIITADRSLVKSHEKTQWKDFQRLHISPSDEKWNIFDVFTTNVESAELLVGDRLIKELAEASFIFDNAPLTAVLFGKKNIFMMIPCEKDMFEASNIYVPVASHQSAIQSKKEIEQLLEIIDVFDLYKPVKN